MVILGRKRNRVIILAIFHAFPSSAFLSLFNQLKSPLRESVQTSRFTPRASRLLLPPFSLPASASAARYACPDRCSTFVTLLASRFGSIGSILAELRFYWDCSGSDSFDFKVLRWIRFSLRSVVLFFPACRIPGAFLVQSA